MPGDRRYHPWFHDNLGCDQITFLELVAWFRTAMVDFYHRASNHSFEKKLVVLLYFLRSQGGYRETSAAFGMSKSWCVDTIAAFVRSTEPYLIFNVLEITTAFTTGDPSLNVQAVVDASLRFMYVDIRPGSYSDKKTWKASTFGQSIQRRMPIGCFIIGDAGYTLLPWLMTPFLPHKKGGILSKLQKNFNYKHSSSRMVVECAFGRLKERFRVLRQP
ncbi:hypothetical protein H257_10907 [Aphanomyces astaci]|uniref:DDE Tnp4 domain-containing protein n=1 Tax=Aphanomyces astaci TaxID=112090 RepID=W4G7C9_APHAT|nr:hypothetical protein H257_10907 [Aphanomyces astaci]ETV74868.1 hypothetical protein H257_10907 [Aphanomyces astaci]|eukprot:XP_009835955.1 hypothetical protein H257_10907 [Aphanomyces astaci]